MIKMKKDDDISDKWWTYRWW